MNAIRKKLAAGPAFIAYLTAGHGGFKTTLQAALALVKGGVDILEIGVPFSDPVADGAVIQQAMQQALTYGATLTATLAMIEALKQDVDVPIVLFSYYNPLLNAGNIIFEHMKKVGVDGVLVVDLPMEESQQYFTDCRVAGLEPVCLLSPSTPRQRIAAIDQRCDSFLYYVCRNGTTGIKKTLPEDFVSKIQAIKKVATNPIAVGFGIANSKQAAQVLKHADAFVVGSYFVNAINDGATPGDLTQLARELDPR